MHFSSFKTFACANQTTSDLHFFLEDTPTRLATPPSTRQHKADYLEPNQLYIFKTDAPFLTQFRNLGNSCWLGAASFGLIWSLKSVNAKLPSPPSIQEGNQGTSWRFVDFFMDWYHVSKDRVSIHPERALFKFADEYVDQGYRHNPSLGDVYKEFIKKKQPQFPNEKAKHKALERFVNNCFDRKKKELKQIKKDFRLNQQDAIIVIEKLLNTKELANFCPTFRDAVIVPTCRKSDDQLCSFEHINIQSDFAGVLQGTVRNEGSDNLQDIVNELQCEKVEANCDTCKKVIVKELTKRLINDDKASLLIINLKRTYHDFDKVKPSVDPQTGEEVWPPPLLLKNDKEVQVPMDINIAYHNDNKELGNEAEAKKQTFTLMAVVEHIGKVKVGLNNKTQV